MNFKYVTLYEVVDEVRFKTGEKPSYRHEYKVVEVPKWAQGRSVIRPWWESIAADLWLQYQMRKFAEELTRPLETYSAVTDERSEFRV